MPIFNPNLATVCISGLLVFTLTACQPEQSAQSLPTPSVKVQNIISQPLALEQSLPGRAVAYMESEVRPQVSGILQKRLFIEGQDVKAGQVLYQIDDAVYQAALNSAKAALAQAEAAVLSAKPKAERNRELITIDAISQQELDEAVANLYQSEASVQSAKAALQSAQIDLNYTRIVAPISGRIGTSSYTPGALVTANQTAALATIQQLDPIYVDVTQSSSQILALRKQIASGDLKKMDGNIPVDIILEDGSPYAQKGTLEYIGASVSTSTGNVTLRTLVPNPDGLLMPGSYVRAVLPAAINENAILVPQSAVNRNTKGEAVVKLVINNIVTERVIQVSEALKDLWIVTGGLAADDQLIIEGGSKVRAGQNVTVETAAVAAQ